MDSFSHESGLSQKPPVRRTWAPRGQTPILRHPFNWKKLSICSALAFRWDGKRTRLLFRIVPDSYTDEKLISFLSELRKECHRRRIILIWDGLPSHRSRRMQQYLHTQQRHLTVVRLPPYAPDLNPVEFARGNIQGKELGNLCSHDLSAMVSGVRDGFLRIHRDRRLTQSFLKHAGISFAGESINYAGLNKSSFLEFPALFHSPEGPFVPLLGTTLASVQTMPSESE